ncbi:hypothetical protein BUALT_Bualt14G0084400 [Buddleja alternifolia]|uniref:CCHC-type domain-containing protein n=1 Tax=Buddleja alternifolia TaxID=168488 RepID=A0AAV6WSZ1_9LAMI|nr:hypothetical protein BUALT_Bualt14G0084400 [Buddleja alternifolia]
MARVPSLFSNLCLRQNPKSFQSSTPQFRNRNLSIDQFNSNSEELNQHPQNRVEIFAHRNANLGENQGFSVSEIAKEVSNRIRTRPRWEQTLLSDFPAVNFSDPIVYNAVLEQQDNVFLSLRFYLWLRSINGSSFDPVLCSGMFSRLVEAKAAHAAKSFLNDTKFEPEPWYLELYIRSLCENGLIDEAVNVFEKLKTISYCSSLETWNLALSHSVRTKRVDVVWRLYGDMMECGIVTDVNTIGHLIQAFCLENNVGKGYELLQQVLEAGHVPDKIIFNKLISACCKNGEYGKVSAVLYNMIAKNRSPDIYTYQEVIKRLCKGRMRHEGFRIFNELKDRGYFPDRVMYTTMIHGLCKNKDLGDARKLWFEMIQKGILPNEYTYNAFIDGLWRSGCIDEAEKLYKEMLEKGYEETTISYNTMINGLCLNGKVEEARLMFDQMNEKGIIRDAITYNSLIKGFSRKGKIKESVYFFYELLNHGFKPSNASFTILIEKLCESGHVKEAETLWQETRDRGLEITISALDPIIFGLSKEGRFAEMMEQLCYMIDNGVRPKKTTFESLIRCLSVADRFDDALSVLGYMLKMDFLLNEVLEVFALLQDFMLNDYDEIDTRCSFVSLQFFPSYCSGNRVGIMRFMVNIGMPSVDINMIKHRLLEVHLGQASGPDSVTRTMHVGLVNADTTFVLELRAILHGMDLSWDAGKWDVTVESDCCEAVELVNEASFEHRLFGVISNIRKMDQNRGAAGCTQYGVEKLEGTNYKYWRLCMEAYLQGQDLWDMTLGLDVIPVDTPENAEARRKWRIKCGKAMFALRTSISKEFIDHVREVDSPKEVWDTLEALFMKKNTSRLQFLENELDGLTQEPRMRRYLIRGMRKEYIPFITSVQGWANQPSILELENLLTNQEALARQMAGVHISGGSDDVLFSKGKRKSKTTSKGSSNIGPQKKSNPNPDKTSYEEKKCYRCGKPGHIKRFCRVKLEDGNLSTEKNGEQDQQIDWEKCFSNEVIDCHNHSQPSIQHGTNFHAVNTSIDYKTNWIFDSGCTHHLTGDDSLISNAHNHVGNRVIVTADNSIHPIEKEGSANVKVTDSENDNVVLKSVYLVPGVRKNLVSVSQITDSGKYVLFGPNDVKVLGDVKEITGNVILTGKKKSNLFVLSASEAYVEKTSRNNSAALWHARTKLDPKAKRCVFVGYDHHRKGWRCMDPENKKFTTSRDVVFDEVSPYYSISKLIGTTFGNIDDFPTKGDLEELQSDSLEMTKSPDTRGRGGDDSSHDKLVSPSQEIIQSTPATRRSTREKRNPIWQKDF